MIYKQNVKLKNKTIAILSALTTFRGHKEEIFYFDGYRKVFVIIGGV